MNGPFFVPYLNLTLSERKEYMFCFLVNNCIPEQFGILI